MAGLVLCASGKKQEGQEKTSHRCSILHCDGYDIVFLKQDYVPVQMHEPFLEESLPAEKDPDIPELKRDRLAVGRSTDNDTQFNAVMPRMPPTRVNTDREKSDMPSLLDLEKMLPEDITAEESLPSWGWLADGVLAEEQARKKADKSKQTVDADALWSDNFFWQDLHGKKMRAGEDKGFWGNAHETWEEKPQFKEKTGQQPFSDWKKTIREYEKHPERDKHKFFFSDF